RLIHATLQPPGAGASVTIHIAHQTIGRAKREVITHDAVLPPVRLDTPLTHLLDDGVAMSGNDERDKLALIPDQLRGQRLVEQSHAITSSHSLARSGRRASASATRARSTTPRPSLARR